MPDIKGTGYTASTPDYYLLHSASVWLNVTYDEALGKFQAERCLGATVGGVKLIVENTIRQIEVDGVFAPAVGQDVLDGTTARMEATVKELTADLLTLSINGTKRAALSTEAPTGYQVVEPKNKIELTDYISNIAVVGKLSGSDQPMIAILYNTISTGGLNMETKDKGEAGVPIVLNARVPADDVENVGGAYKLFFPPKALGVTGVTLDKSTLNLAVAGISKLTAIVAPATATNKNVTWATSNPAVATVDNGYVTGVGAGTANITVTTVDGLFNAVCEVTVA
ncbi:MAG: Ig-like domain-containing protein [Sedimentibacter sp.]|uniref:Ig-like domain-containing protein n=1 Tax=Sedimentibacter sp. TaxID=1960295 RepID=UPI002981FD4A|nr:Ig-like domain-containing protein [Sedimentibacter sp.]MDW5300756.1 Ig-like domain-containing protein [Sedimentibacter sp.]